MCSLASLDHQLPNEIPGFPALKEIAEVSANGSGYFGEFGFLFTGVSLIVVNSFEGKAEGTPTSWDMRILIPTGRD